jgi:hypothetical protein
MDNSQNTAYPVVLPHSECDYTKGLTKLETFTMAAMQGLLSQNDIHLMKNIADEKGVPIETALAKTAIEVAKATLAELSKSDTNV